MGMMCVLHTHIILDYSRIPCSIKISKIIPTSLIMSLYCDIDPCTVANNDNVHTGIQHYQGNTNAWYPIEQVTH